MTGTSEAITSLLGLDKSSLELSIDEMVLRAGVVYLFALAVIRLGHKRFLGNLTAFDVVLGIILGSVVSRAITGSAAFFPTLLAGLSLVLLHWVMSATAYRWHRFGSIIKGEARVLIEDGEVIWDQMRSSHISELDLEQSLRESGGLAEISAVEEARLERSGLVSVVPKSSSAQILEITVEQGIQTVRIKLE